MKFYKCNHCGNIIVKIEDKGVPVVCCAERMSEIIPGTVDAAREKHVPVVEINENNVKVSVGSVEHPMLEKHHIAWVVLETNNGYQIKYLEVNKQPAANFSLSNDDKVVAAYEYCNIHGLWKTEV